MLFKIKSLFLTQYFLDFFVVTWIRRRNQFTLYAQKFTSSQVPGFRYNCSNAQLDVVLFLQEEIY